MRKKEIIRKLEVALARAERDLERKTKELEHKEAELTAVKRLEFRQFDKIIVETKTEVEVYVSGIKLPRLTKVEYIAEVGCKPVLTTETR